jgi:cytochrome c-type biogenesis protein CcmH
MITFAILAAALTIAAAVAVAIPLLRRDAVTAQAPWTAVAVGGLLLAGAGGLYLALSNWNWSKAQAAADSPQTMVARLARRLARNPDDMEGWLMLGRSYMTLEQTPLAVRAFEQADRLANGTNVDALMGLAEALSVEDDSALKGRAGDLIERALVLAPRSPKALFYGAVAATRRGDLRVARQRYTDLLALDPPENVKPLLTRQIDAIDQQLAAASRTQENGNAATTADHPAGAAVPAVAVRVKVALSPKLSLEGSAGAPLFVFVRDPKQPGPPLAVKRLEMRFPQTVELTPADAMVTGRAFAAGQDVEVVARIGRSGSAIAHSGDPFGAVGYHVGRDGVVDVIIDRLTP